jgi:8-oxo-dGTP diphosphatase
MKLTRVAAAVIVRPDGTFLLAQRPDGKPYPGYWEFPGGKIEADETAADALLRELKEELDITVTRATPWITRVHSYTHATVHLAFFRVTAWHGEPRGLEGQAHVWQSIHAPDVAPMLPANTPIFRALLVPQRMAVSDCASDALWPERAADWVARSSNAIIQLREKAWAGDAARILAAAEPILRATRVMSTNEPHNALVLNSDMVAGDTNALQPLWDRGAGLHMSSKALASASARPEFLLPAALWGASCHTRDELLHAANIGVDYSVLGPVRETRSHPGLAGMGWGGWRELSRDLPMPIFAIGGLAYADAKLAAEHGAHGVAALSNGLHDA